MTTIETETHPCEMLYCNMIVTFDDEPYCFEHSSWDGSTVFGYSYKATH